MIHGSQTASFFKLLLAPNLCQGAKQLRRRLICIPTADF